MVITFLTNTGTFGQYSATGFVNGKPFVIVCEDVYSITQIQRDNPNLTLEECVVLEQETTSHAFTNGETYSTDDRD